MTTHSNARTATKIIIVLGIAAAVFVLYAPDAHAGTTAGGGLPYEGFLQSLRNSITGPWALTLSLVGIVLSGSALIFGGDLSGFFRSMILVALVVSLLIGANNAISTFAGTGALIAFASPGITV